MLCPLHPLYTDHSPSGVYFVGACNPTLLAEAFILSSSVISFVGLYRFSKSYPLSSVQTLFFPCINKTLTVCMRDALKKSRVSDNALSNDSGEVEEVDMISRKWVWTMGFLLRLGCLDFIESNISCVPSVC
jgi:hypothetical protein